MPRGDDERIEFRRLAGRERPVAEGLERLGSVAWHTTTVELDLEIKGEVERVPGSRSQRQRRA